jgi:hypothetical protein
MGNYPYSVIFYVVYNAEILSRSLLEDSCVLGCDAVLLGEWSDVSKALHSIKMLGVTHPVTQCHIPKDLYPPLQSCENLRSHMLQYLPSIFIEMEVCAAVLIEPGNIGCAVLLSSRHLKFECVIFLCRWKVLPSYQQGCGFNKSEESVASWRNH